MGTGSFPGVKSGQGVTLTPHPLLEPWSRKGRAIPLLPLWAVRLVESLSACTGVHFSLICILELDWTDRQVWYWIQILLVSPNVMPHCPNQIGISTLTTISARNIYMTTMAQNGTPLVD